MEDFSIKNGWLELPSEEELLDYMKFLSDKLPSIEQVGFMNFREGVMNMYYQLQRIKKEGR